MLESLGYAAVYSGIGLLLLALGFFVLDLLTPGRLADHIWEHGSPNASITLASALIAQSLVAFATIWTHAEAGFGEALEWTIAFGVLGIALQAISFFLLDLVTPGKLGDLVCRKDFHPASVVSGASQLAVAIIVVACIV